MVDSYFPRPKGKYMLTIIDKEGKTRPATEMVCKNCNIKFLRATRLIRDINNSYCSRKCKGLSSRNRIQLKCAFCNISFERPLSKLAGSKSGMYFCSRSCKDIGQKLENNIKEIWPKHYGTSKSSNSKAYRSLAFSTYEHKCNRCGISKEDFPYLEVHHIDRNRDNNNIDNLEILCPNCHTKEHYDKMG